MPPSLRQTYAFQINQSSIPSCYPSLGITSTTSLVEISSFLLATFYSAYTSTSLNENPGPSSLNTTWTPTLTFPMETMLPIPSSSMMLRLSNSNNFYGYSITHNYPFMKSTLFLLDAEDQLTSMKLPDNEDAKTHLSKLNQHFQLMLQCCNNLVQTGSTISDTHFNIIIMLSLLESYRPTLQTITATKRASTLSSGKASSMKPNDLIPFILEEAQHCVINDECTKNAEIALATHTKKAKSNKPAKC